MYGLILRVSFQCGLNMIVSKRDKSTKKMPKTTSFSARRGLLLAAPLAAALALSACGEVSQRVTHGYVVSPEALEQVPVGSSREQVLLALGSPSTTAMIGGEAYYYISQIEERPIAFMKSEIVEQRVLAVYFDEEGRVREVGNYGLKDGRVFDFLTRKTRTGGADYSFLAQMLKGLGRSTS